MSQEQETRFDCHNQCFAWGILPKFKDLCRETPDDAWECPPVPKRTHHTLPPEKILTVDSIPLPMVGD